jgi:hypothetical protein
MAPIPESITKFIHPATKPNFWQSKTGTVSAGVCAAPNADPVDSFTKSAKHDAPVDVNFMRRLCAPRATADKCKTITNEQRATLRAYVNQNDGPQQKGSLGFLNFLHGEDEALGINLGRHLPPGVFTVAIHGRAPFTKKGDNESYSKDAAQRPFIATEEQRGDVVMSTRDLAESIIASGCKDTIFLVACNAGTERGYSDGQGHYMGSHAAADLAKLTGQPVVAPCNGKANISGAGRDGAKLAQNPWASVTPTWMVYNPDGTSENL